MDVMLWVLIGLGAGGVMTAVMPDTRTRLLSARAWRRIGGSAVGAVGAIVGGYALAALAPGARDDDLTMALGSLAGALWLTCATFVVASRGLRDEWSAAFLDAAAPPPPERDVPAYDATRHALVEHLIEDAAAHDAGRYVELGRHLAAVLDSVPRDDAPEDEKLHIALTFWREWIDARDRRWSPSGATDGVAMADWPRLARGIASDLAVDRDISDPTVRTHFAPTPPR
jgi:hypothetical protein